MKHNIDRKNAVDRAISRFKWRQRAWLIGLGILFFGFTGCLYLFAFYSTVPAEKLEHAGYFKAIVQNSLVKDYRFRSSVSFRVKTVDGGDHTLVATHPHSLGITGDQACVEFRIGKETGKNFPRLVNLRNCSD